MKSSVLIASVLLILSLILLAADKPGAPIPDSNPQFFYTCLTPETSCIAITEPECTACGTKLLKKDYNLEELMKVMKDVVGSIKSDLSDNKLAASVPKGYMIRFITENSQNFKLKKNADKVEQFNLLAQTLHEDTKNFERAAESNNRAEAMKCFKIMTAKCGECHKQFR